MEDFMQFLVVAGFIAIGMYRQFGKDKKKNAEKSIPIPTHTHNPDIFPPINATKKKSKKKSTKTPLPEEGVRSTSSLQKSETTLPPKKQKPQANESDFAIHSAEEARRAIVWSEILNRKY